MKKDKMAGILIGAVIVVAAALLCYGIMLYIKTQDQKSKKWESAKWVSMELNYFKGNDGYSFYANFLQNKAIVKTSENENGTEVALTNKEGLLTYLKEHGEEILGADAVKHYGSDRIQGETRYNWMFAIKDDGGESDQIISTKEIPDCIKNLITECNKAIGQETFKY